MSLHKARTEGGWPPRALPAGLGATSCSGDRVLLHTASEDSFIRRNSTPGQANSCGASARRFDGCPRPICWVYPRGPQGHCQGWTGGEARLHASLGSLSRSGQFLFCLPAPESTLGAGSGLELGTGSLTNTDRLGLHPGRCPWTQFFRDPRSRCSEREMSPRRRPAPQRPPVGSGPVGYSAGRRRQPCV